METKDIKISNGIFLHAMKTDRFKTNYIVINLLSKLNREDVTKNALIPLVLRRGTMNYPTMQDLSIKLEEMYGASFDANTDKLGDNTIIQFVLDTISDEYTLDNSELLREGIELICDIVLNPLLENGTFKKEYVEQEKDTLKEIINSKINDKATYSMERAVEEMYRDEPYGLYKYGYVEDLGTIDSESLYNHYLELLKSAEIHIYVSGNIDELDVAEQFNEYIDKIERDFKEDAIKKVAMALNELKLAVPDDSLNTSHELIEHQNVTQGKLVLGYRVKDYDIAKDFYKMNVYSAILGGTASSKLFNNVREKKSLAYTIRSQFIKHKGAMFVSAGIELENFELAKECILKEIEDMKKSNISEEELHDAKVNLVTRFKSFGDSQAALIGWSVGQKLIDGDEDIDRVIEKINQITIEDVVEVASRLSFDLIYYLTA